MICDLCKVNKNEDMIGIGVPGESYGKICAECASKVRKAVEIREAYVHEEARRSIYESEPNVENGHCCVCGYTGKAKRFWYHPHKFALICPDCLNAISAKCREKSPAESVEDFKREYEVSTKSYRNLKAECNTLRNRLQMREKQLDEYRDHARKYLREIATKDEIIKSLKEKPEKDHKFICTFMSYLGWLMIGFGVCGIISEIVKAFA